MQIEQDHRVKLGVKGLCKIHTSYVTIEGTDELFCGSRLFCY